jgi:hypothetical protein
MTSWKDIAKKGNQTANDQLETQNIKINELEKKEIQTNENIIAIQEELEPDILDTYSRLEEVLYEGLYSYILDVDRPEKMSSFIKMIHKNINYNYYLNIENSEMNENESDNTDEFHPWENKRNRFAYI